MGKRGQHTMEAEAMDIELVVWTAVLGVLGVACSYLLYSRTSAAKPTIAYSTPAAKQVAKAEDSDSPPMLVLSGSQTGTVEDMSEKFAKEMKRHGFDAKPVDMEVYEMDGMELLADEKMVVFFTATHGEGDPTDNARGFYDYLGSKDREPGELSGVKYAVFGLGNRQYEEYNSMGRFFDKRMEELGAKRVGKYGEGDDDQDIEADFDLWREQNLMEIKTHFLGAEAANIVAPPELEYHLTEVKPKAIATALEKGQWATFLAASNRSIIDHQVWLPAKLAVKRE